MISFEKETHHTMPVTSPNYEESVQKSSKEVPHKNNLKLQVKNNSSMGQLPLGSVRLISHMAALRPVVICGPSGSGKSTLLKCLMEEYGEFFGFSVSHTTRKPRPGEKNGRDYHFVSREVMENSIENGEFLEFTEFSGNLYGTSKQSVTDVHDDGRICILDIEIEGVKNIKKTDLNPHFIFIEPPSMDVLEERLRGRGTETEESIQKRLNRASAELQYGSAPGNFDIVLVNDDVDDTYKELKQFLIKDIEELKRRQGGQ